MLLMYLTPNAKVPPEQQHAFTLRSAGVRAHHAYVTCEPARPRRLASASSSAPSGNERGGREALEQWVVELHPLRRAFSISASRVRGSPRFGSTCKAFGPRARPHSGRS